MAQERSEREHFLNQVSILRQQGLTVRAIAAQMGIHPSRVQRALKALQRRGAGPTPGRDNQPPSDPWAKGRFIGRRREMDDLRPALEDALGGHGHLVMLVGEPGIGKTRTAQELAAYAEQAGAQVLWG